MPELNTDKIETQIRLLAAMLEQEPVKRASVTIDAPDPDALAARFEPHEVERCTYVYPPDVFGNDGPSVIDAVRLVLGKIDFSIGQSSREPSEAELAALEATTPKQPAISMPNGSDDAA